jgi:hypothetical protein
MARQFGVAEDVAYTCETAGYFWLLHVLARHVPEFVCVCECEGEREGSFSMSGWFFSQFVAPMMSVGDKLSYEAW